MKLARLVTSALAPRPPLLSRRVRWSAAIVGVVIAMGLRGWLDPWLADTFPFLLAFPTVVFVAWLAGFGPAALTACLCVAWLLTPAVQPSLGPHDGWRPITIFLPTALVLAFIASHLPRARVGPHWSESAGALRWLKTMMWMAAVVPLLAFLGAGWYLRAQVTAQAKVRIDQAARVAEEHALKIFETNIALLNRASDLIGDEPDAAVLARESEIHRTLKRMTTDLPQLQGLFILGAAGEMLATDRLFPAPHEINYTDRALYRHHRSGGPQPFVTDVLTSRATGELFFDMSLRRNRADGTFGGVLSASMSPAYFGGFYRELTGGDAQLGIALVGPDGAVLARWPQPPTSSDSVAGPASRMQVDTFGKVSTAALGDGTRGLIDSRALRGYPVRVVAWMERSAVLAPWQSQIALLGALMLPAAAGLAYLSAVALQRTRHALRVLDQLREETAQRRRVEDALRQAQKLEAMGRLTGGVAHDFNNLLMVVSNNLYLLRRLQPEVADSAQLAAIGRAVEAGAKLTRQLLSFSRRQALHPERIDLQQRLSAVLDMLKPALGSNVRVSAQVEPDTAAIEVDAAELELALLNLAINAKDAMPDGGRLDIVAANATRSEAPADGAFVCITVKDNGAGIEPALLDRVFEPFFTTKPVGQGTGLGLSQVYGFCARAGGTATIDSKVGLGSTIRLLLPAAAAATEDTMPAPAAPITPLRDLHVLLVEDNDEVAAATQSVLESMGCRVSRRVNADDALRALDERNGAFDVMLTDIVMPGAIDGLELCDRVGRAFPQLPVVVMSGYSASMSRAADQQLDVLPKPCPPAALAAAITKAIGIELRRRTLDDASRALAR